MCSLHALFFKALLSFPVSTGLPVMVYLFGGAFLLGASNDVSFMGNSLYDGKEMADRGGVVVVTVNYRVGTLGFLSTGDSRLPGQPPSRWDMNSLALSSVNFPSIHTSLHIMSGSGLLG